jgi:hypothetical protein
MGRASRNQASFLHRGFQPEGGIQNASLNICKNQKGEDEIYEILSHVQYSSLIEFVIPKLLELTKSDSSFKEMQGRIWIRALRGLARRKISTAY